MHNETFKNQRKMKTAMQDLLDWVRAIKPMDLGTPLMIERKIESMFEKEKEQIIDAWLDGDNSDCLSEQDSSDFAERYYNETFNTNEK